MQSLFSNLGLDWKLLASQAVNFLLVLLVLRLTVYTPFLELIEKRRKRIKEGVEKAEEADRRLSAISALQNEKIKEAEAQSLRIIQRAEEKAKQEGRRILDDVLVKEAEILTRAKEKARAEELAARKAAESGIVHLVREILVKTVTLKPESVDEALIEKVTRNTTRLP